MFKSHSSESSPLHHYLLQNMTPMHPHLQRLWKDSQQDPENVMLAAAEEVSLLQMLIQLTSATKTLDIGVYTGFSALAAAMVLPPGGRVVACDVTDTWLERYGKPVWRDAGVEDKIDFRLGPAIQTLQGLLDAGEAETFDFAFIDADKYSYSSYYELCLQLLRRGGIVAVDNALWGGRVLLPPLQMDAKTSCIHQLNTAASRDPRVHATIVNTGDGLLLCRKL